ncbi:atrial natriuretic peptide receptor 1-like [Paramacrobiotus metropolitanus]|uniref:atrial natriuretic peptide receptor 1-like n=1 Tax=Paramacrobiotus metropolitanus TaxID=2943436 RepID=UPI002445CCD4|nr:atrial natriuretic peptide receptor 1-like [Paramacrobiotus metropolitanus]
MIPAIAGSVSVLVVLLILIPIGVYTYIQKTIAAKRDPYWWRIYRRELVLVVGNGTGIADDYRVVDGDIGDTLGPRERSVTFSEPIEKSFSGKGDLVQLDAVARAYYALPVIYRSNPVGLADLPQPKHKASPRVVKSVTPLKALHHTNLHHFIGIVLSDDNVCQYTVGELCHRRTLTNLLLAESFPLDQACKNSLIMDIVDGMNMLHGSDIKSHGNLTSGTCLITSQLVLKVTDYGIPMLTRPLHWTEPPSNSQTERNFYTLLWRAPELLRHKMNPFGTQQIILRSGPFRLEDSAITNDKAREIVAEIQHGSVPPLRPPVPSVACNPRIYGLMETCWEENPDERPAFSRIRSTVNRIIGQSERNLIGSLMKSMEKYAITLESQVEEQTRNFMEEKRRSEQMLSFLLPQSIADAMQRREAVHPEMFDSATVCFADVPMLSEMLESGSSLKWIVDVLNSLCGIFDTVTRKFEVYDVETINDAHLLVSGVPVRNGQEHAKEIVCMAAELLHDTNKLSAHTDGLANRRSSSLSYKNLSEEFDLRFGINTGPCVAGVIGLKLPRYCLFGDTVNTAARMKTYGIAAGKIHSSLSTKYLLDRTCPDRFLFTSRGKIDIKSKGFMETYWVVDSTQQLPS